MTKNDMALDRKDIAVLICFSLVVIVVVLSYNTAILESKNTASMNAYADLWCQDQTYSIINKDVKVASCHIQGQSQGVLIDFITPVDENGNCKYSYGELFPLGEGIEPSKDDNFIISYSYDKTPIETRHYTTGKWLSSENKIECLGEPEEDLSGVVGGSRNYGDKSQYLGSDEPIKPIIIYQKSQKFEVPKM